MKLLSTLLLILTMALPSLAATTWPASTNANQTFFGTQTFLRTIQGTATNAITAEIASGVSAQLLDTGLLWNDAGTIGSTLDVYLATLRTSGDVIFGGDVYATNGTVHFGPNKTSKASVDTDTGTFTGNGAGLTKLNAQTVLNVKAAGAVGDAVTDDTAAIQSALNSAAAGGTVHFPPGKYAVSSALLVRGNHTKITGASSAYDYDSYSGTLSNMSTIVWTAPSASGIDFGTNNFCQIVDIALDGGNVVTNGIVASRASLIDNTLVLNCVGAGICLSNAINATHMSRVTSIRNGVGIRSGSDVFSTNWTLDKSNIRQNRIGLYLEMGTPVVTSCVIESNTEIGALFSSVSGGSLLTNGRFVEDHFENNPVSISCINGGAFTYGMVFDQCIFSISPGTNLNLIAANGWRFRDCKLFGGYYGSVTNIVGPLSQNIIFERTIDTVDSTPVWFPGGLSPSLIVSVNGNTNRIDGSLDVRGFIGSRMKCPQAPLDIYVADSGNEGEAIRLGRGDANRFNSINNISASSTGSKIKFMVHNGNNAVDQTNALTLSGGGNVGIATDSPLYTLDVRGYQSLDGVHAFGMSDVGVLSYDRGSAYFSGYKFQTAASSGLFIDNLGNVGIGTTVPTSRLSVSGPIGAPTITLTNNPTFQTTNAEPTGFVLGVTLPAVWLAWTNNGHKYITPGFEP